jgi:hypothetical protein
MVVHVLGGSVIFVVYLVELIHIVGGLVQILRNMWGMTVILHFWIGDEVL